MGYTACTEWCHLWWISLDFFVWSKKRNANWAPAFQACTWRVHYEQASELCRKPLEARGLCTITAMELQESQEENSPGEIIWLCVSLEKSMPMSQLRKESRGQKQSYHIHCGQREGTERGGAALLCSAMTFAKSMRMPTQVCVQCTHPAHGQGLGMGAKATPCEEPWAWGRSCSGCRDWFYRWCIWKVTKAGLWLNCRHTWSPCAVINCWHVFAIFLRSNKHWHAPAYPDGNYSAVVLLCTQGGDFSGSQEMLRRAHMAQRAASWNTLRKPHQHRNGSGYVIRQVPCLMILTLKCTKGCSWGHAQWQKHLEPSGTEN